MDSEMTKRASDNSTVAVTKFNQLPDIALVRLSMILCLLPCSRATFWRWVKNGRIPAPKKMGSKISVWSAGQIRELLKAIADGQGI
jgi:predicted DNA-binding transcriptional regulator AlpA